ncbi:unnamed protein product [Gordionus sp. m RMFG-2023]
MILKRRRSNPHTPDVTGVFNENTGEINESDLIDSGNILDDITKKPALIELGTETESLSSVESHGSYKCPKRKFNDIEEDERILNIKRLQNKKTEYGISNTKKVAYSVTPNFVKKR